MLISSTSSDETEKLGEVIGKKLKGGEIIELSSDLGGGKTTFVRGLAKGMGSLDTVASPTFMICKQYRSNELKMYHYDFYRLNEPGIISHELEEGIHDPKAIVVVEWADIIKNILPKEKISITIKAKSENTRDIEIRCSSKFLYLLEGVS